MNIDDYLSHDALGLAHLVNSGEVTAVAPVEAAIKVIEARNPSLNAVIQTNYARAREAARAIPTGVPLAGVPFLLKDVYLNCKDMPTTWGSRYFSNAAPRTDSLMVERWRQSGVVMLGRTNAPEFAAEFVTEPAAYGRTLNPWNAGVTVGGSSGGAAAAVASGMVPLAHATDLGGSIRIPAACCGLYGFKPTPGLNPSARWRKEFAHGLNSDHVLTRSVRDSAASLDATSNGHHLASLHKTPGALRILATVHSADGRLAGSHQVNAVMHATDLLRDLGHTVRLADHSPLISVGDWFDLLWIDDIPGLLADQASRSGMVAKEDDLEPMTRAALARLREQGSGAVAQALRLREETARTHLALFETWDLLLTPSLAADPAPLGTLAFNDLGSFERWAQEGYAFAPFSILANIAGQPSASLPLPLQDCEIPVGIQLTGRPGCDLQLLQVSRQIEGLVGWERAFKALWAKQPG